jgi:hypothetical protein
MLYVLLKFCKNGPKKILFSLRSKKRPKKSKWPNHFFSRKLFQKRPNGNPSARKQRFDDFCASITPKMLVKLISDKVIRSFNRTCAMKIGATAS